MSNLTTCSKCSKCYEEVSEEEANAPDRLCGECWKRVRYGSPNNIKAAIEWAKTAYISEERAKMNGVPFDCRAAVILELAAQRDELLTSIKSIAAMINEAIDQKIKTGRMPNTTALLQTILDEAATHYEKSEGIT